MFCAIMYYNTKGSIFGDKYMEIVECSTQVRTICLFWVDKK